MKAFESEMCRRVWCLALGVVTALGCRRAASEHPLREPVVFVALGSDRGIAVDDGFNQPFRASGVQGDARFSSRWTWTGDANTGSDPWMWTRRGNLVAGEIHPVAGEGPLTVAIFDGDRGFLARIDNVPSGQFAFVDDHTVMAVAGGGTSLQVVDVATSPATVSQAPWSAGPTVGRLGATETYIVASTSNGLQVFSRPRLALQRTIAPYTDVIGIAAGRDEALLLRDGRMAVVSLADGSDHRVVDLGDGHPVGDGIDDPCLLGRYGDRWVVLYAVDLIASVQTNGQTYSIPAAKFVAAVDSTTGNVLWRRPVGRWEISCVENTFRDEFPSDAEIASPLMVHGVADVTGGGAQRGYLATIDLDTGAPVWETTFDRDSLGGNFFARRGTAVYARMGEANVDGLLRFDHGRLTAALRTRGLTSDYAAPSTAADAVWIGGLLGRWMLSGPDLHVVSADGDRTAVTDARAWAIQRFALPPAAR